MEHRPNAIIVKCGSRSDLILYTHKRASKELTKLFRELTQLFSFKSVGLCRERATMFDGVAFLWGPLPIKWGPDRFTLDSRLMRVTSTNPTQMLRAPAARGVRNKACYFWTPVSLNI
jgi:hypothetical protein